MEMFTADEITAMFGESTAKSAKEITEEPEQAEEEINNDNNNNNETTTDEEERSTQESRGSKGEENTLAKNVSDSPNIYSSIAKALKDEGVFPDLSIEDIKDAASLKKMFEIQVDNRLNQQQKRIKEALDYGVEPTEIQRYENTLGYLFNIKEQDLIAESSEGEKLRKQLIYQDFINKGYSQEKAKKEVEKSLNAGTDIDDAKDALEENKKFYHQKYEALREIAKKEEEEFANKRKQNLENLKKSIDNKENAFGSLALDVKTKAKIYENLTKPVYKTEEGEYLTALQKYERENSQDFLRYVGAFFTLTDGFTDFSKLFKPVAQKAVKNGFSQLEDVLKGNVTKEGNLKLMGNNKDGEYFSGNWKLDI